MTKEIRRLRELAGINLKDKFILNELFDKPYPYEWTTQKNNAWGSKFKNVDGHIIDVNFDIDDDEIYGKSVGVEFKRNDKSDITGQKDQFRIFATVLTIMKDFIKNNNDVFEVYFSAFGISRASLYRRMLSRFADENGFEFEEVDTDTYSRFYLSKKE